MKRKELILNKIIEITDESGITAQSLSNILGMNRGNVSADLNTLCKEGLLEKTKSRPVRFFIPIKNSKINDRVDIFKEFEKDNISLRNVINQARAAILYPPKGLNCIILGETGVGKSMFASMMYEYAVNMRVKERESPFIIFNCADYSNNPQLLTSLLFGVKKGAFTGAEDNRIGLIDKANGGILFLDEVHRLPPEGQEALFTFIDTNRYRRVGDSEFRESNALIIAATTENPDSVLLQTFIRRMPMSLYVPSLKERTLEERLNFVRKFFYEESKKLNLDITVSFNVMRALLSYNCPNNIGQLKSDIQLICAKAYANFLTNRKKSLNVEINILPINIKSGLYNEKNHRILWNKLFNSNTGGVTFSPIKQAQKFNEENNIYTIIKQKMDGLKKDNLNKLDINRLIGEDILKYFQKNSSEILNDINKRSLVNILGNDFLDFFEDVMTKVMKSLGRTIDSNMYIALALHINNLISRVKVGQEACGVNHEITGLKDKYPDEYRVAYEIKNKIEICYEVSIDKSEVEYLAFFILPENSGYIKSNEKVGIIFTAHGESTATSVTNLANTLLGEDYAIGINCPIDMKPANVLQSLRQIIKDNYNKAGYLILADMGSLTTFGELLEEEFNVKIKTIPLVSTLHVIEATRKAILGYSLNDIYKQVKDINYNSENRNVNYDNKKPRFVVVAACSSGIGSSVAIKKYLELNLEYDKNMLEIVTLEAIDRTYFLERISRLKETREILFLVSSFPIDIDVRQFLIKDVLSMKELNELQEIIDIKTSLMNIKFVIKENVKFVDGEEVYLYIMNFMKNLEAKLSLKIEDKQRIGIILHIAFMIDNIMSGNIVYENKYVDQIREKYTYEYEIIKEQFIISFNKYKIYPSDDEICFIIDSFIKNIQI
ncbi:sigma 54-interacting transcriptional regulator [Clostridium paraputrificum]|uniref:sigma 54-interacting transcriptional regulator n=1 Tax=Clostridium paraputrificum TaxID=29363 RepID=UPI000666F1B4|nr:sigma-54-dependent transcriptional regulator [Clostridium paraputrificum]MDB2105909.1 sigma 54-interacting transcriptional regulator [Clostridium paraputrificum]MDB2112784.1 sigma 54-interacting transcriptional regulator [Clostridium paraputrificum]